MKPLAAILAFALPVVAAAASHRIEIKTPAEVTEISECADGMEAGTICRFIPLNAVTFNVPNVNPGLPPFPVKIVMPPGLRSIHAQIKLEVSPSSVCDPVPSDVYDGFGGLTISCSEE